ncbi:MAG: hypothetical protein K6G45_12050 [Lachnospiraceae bacterium]|nr:hypothetical protein [Lachnospiraceae bacterium]
MNNAKLKRILSVVAGIALIIIVVLYYTGVIGGSHDESQQGSGSQQEANSQQGSGSQQTTDFQQGSGTQQTANSQQGSDSQQSADSQQGNETQPVDNSSQENEGQQTSDSQQADDSQQYYFRSNKLLTQHYEKHGIEMGFDSKEAYEKAASDVINNPAALHKTEAEDGDYVYYVEETNEFVVLSKDGYIRTYFLPSAGKAYYDRQ